MNQTPAQRRADSHTPGKTNQPKHSVPLSYCRNIYSAFPDLCLASWQATPQKESLPLASPSSAKQECSPFPELCKGRKRDQTGCRSALVFTWGRASVNPGTHSQEKQQPPSQEHLSLNNELGLQHWFSIDYSQQGITQEPGKWWIPTKPLVFSKCSLLSFQSTEENLMSSKWIGPFPVSSFRNSQDTFCDRAILSL